MAIRKARALDGRVAIVTGAGGAVGRSIALALAARGVRVLAMGRDERRLGETVGEIAHAGGKARHVVGDARATSDVDLAIARAVELFGPLAIAIAIGEEDEHGRAADDAARAVLEADVIGAFRLFDAAARTMDEGGRLVAASRVVGEPGASGFAARSAAAGGVAGLVRATAIEAAARAITCNAIARASASAADEVAELVVFLCSSAGDAITGQTFSIGG